MQHFLVKTAMPFPHIIYKHVKGKRCDHIDAINIPPIIMHSFRSCMASHQAGMKVCCCELNAYTRASLEMES